MPNDKGQDERRAALLRAALHALNHAPGFRFNAQDNPAGLQKVDGRNWASSYELAGAIERELHDEGGPARPQA